MSQKNPRPANAPWLSPYLTVQDADKAVDFYQKAFRFQVRDKAPGEDGTTWHAELTYKDQMIMLGKADGYCQSKSPAMLKIDSPMTLYIYCENVDEFYQAATKAGAQSVSPPEDMFWGDRMCSLKDPDGYTWSFATHNQA